MKKLVFYWLPFLCNICLIVILNTSSLPKSIGFHYSDKIGHFGIYFIFVFLTLRLCLFQKSKTKIQPYVIVTIIIMFFGILNEFHQILISGRTFEVADIVANSIGVIIGGFFFFGFHK